MKMIQEVMDSIGAVPKLRLGEKIKGGGVRSTGPHTVKFSEEPRGITKKNFEGKPGKYLRFLVEENGMQYRWDVAVLNRENEPNYLLERLLGVIPGEERVLEMTKQGARNYIDVREVGAPSTIPDEDEGEEQDVQIDG